MHPVIRRLAGVWALGWVWVCGELLHLFPEGARKRGSNAGGGAIGRRRPPRGQPEPSDPPPAVGIDPGRQDLGSQFGPVQLVTHRARPVGPLHVFPGPRPTAISMPPAPETTACRPAAYRFSFSTGPPYVLWQGSVSTLASNVIREICRPESRADGIEIAGRGRAPTTGHWLGRHVRDLIAMGYMLVADERQMRCLGTPGAWPMPVPPSPAQASRTCQCRGMSGLAAFSAPGRDRS
jgi:hypothetical protein